MYCPQDSAGEANPSVWIGGPVHEEDKRFWALHEWKCAQNPDIDSCLAVTKEELNAVRSLKGSQFLIRYITRRSRMLNAVLSMNLSDPKLTQEDEIAKIPVVRTILKIGASLEYLQTFFEEAAMKVIGPDVFENLIKQEDIFARYGYLVLGK